MERDRWRTIVLAVVIANLVLALAGIGIGIAALNRTSTSSPSPAPTATLLGPASGATLSGSTALAAQPVGSVVAVDFVLNGGTLHDVKVASGSLSLVGWTAKWDTRAEPNGPYNLATIAYTAQGQSGRSPSVLVTISN